MEDKYIGLLKSWCWIAVTLFIGHREVFLQEVHPGLVFIFRPSYIVNYNYIIFYFNFLKDFIYLFLENGRREKERKKHQCVVASRTPLIGDLAPTLGMYPD